MNYTKYAQVFVIAFSIFIFGQAFLLENNKDNHAIFDDRIEISVHSSSILIEDGNIIISAGNNLILESDKIDVTSSSFRDVSISMDIDVSGPLKVNATQLEINGTIVDLNGSLVAIN